MAQYMLLLYDDPANWAGISPEEMQKAIEKYVAWRHKLQAQGIFAGSHKLAGDMGRVLRKRDGKPRVTDGPYSETKEVLGGYFILTAAGYDEAVEHARGCPHLDYGGTIEVREVDALTAT